MPTNLARTGYIVSIPQSGLQAFRPFTVCHHQYGWLEFQSLNRAYKRSDRSRGRLFRDLKVVSIPQSGLQAFRHGDVTYGVDTHAMFQSLNRAYKRSDAEVIEVAREASRFQSLNRAYKRSDGQCP